MISRAEKVGDMVEVWLDGIADLDTEKVAVIVKFARKPLILNLKDKTEKGSFHGNSLARFQLLTKSKAAYVDLPLSFPAKLIQQFKRENPKTKLILSSHDFQKTPTLPTLRKLAQQAIQAKADVVKLVGFARNHSEMLPILQISQELAVAKKQFITISMGEAGEITRVITPLLGGLGMFAPLTDKNKTAAGQIPASQLKQLWGKIII